MVEPWIIAKYKRRMAYGLDGIIILFVFGVIGAPGLIYLTQGRVMEGIILLIIFNMVAVMKARSLWSKYDRAKTEQAYLAEAKAASEKNVQTGTEKRNDAGEAI